MKRHLLALVLALATPLAPAAVLPIDRIAAVVDEAVILESEVQARLADIRYQLQRRGTTAPPDQVLRDQVMERLVIETLQVSMAERGGIRIDDNTLNNALTELAKQNQQTLAEFQQELDRTPGIRYADVREQVKHELMIQRLRQRRVGDRIRITDQDVQNYLASPQGREALETEYRLAHIQLSVPEKADDKRIAKTRAMAEKLLAELKAGARFADLATAYSTGDFALKGGDLGWRKEAELPSLFADPVKTLKRGEVTLVQSPAGFHLLQLLDQRGGGEMLVAQTQVRHILIKPTEILSLEEAKEKALSLRARLQKGEDFAQLARLHSDDPGSARNGGDLGWINPGDMVPEFEKTYAVLKEQEISDVIQSPYGWHVVQVLGRREQDVSENWRANQARQALYARQFEVELVNWLREIRAQAFVEIRDGAK